MPSPRCSVRTVRAEGRQAFGAPHRFQGSRCTVDTTAPETIRSCDSDLDPYFWPSYRHGSWEPYIGHTDLVDAGTSRQQETVTAHTDGHVSSFALRCLAPSTPLFEGDRYAIAHGLEPYPSSALRLFYDDVERARLRADALSIRGLATRIVRSSNVACKALWLVSVSRTLRSSTRVLRFSRSTSTQVRTTLPGDSNHAGSFFFSTGGTTKHA